MKKILKEHSKEFITVWSITTTLIIIAYYSTNIYEHFGLKASLLLLAGAFVFAILFLVIKSLLAKTSPLTVVYTEVLSEISNFKSAATNIYKRKNYLGLKMISWRANNETGYANQLIDNSLRLPALKAFAYHRKIFGKILLKLDKGDTYYTLSNLDFWSKDKYGQQDFLQSYL